MDLGGSWMSNAHLGKSPPRALECFGVAGLLAEGCQVFYQSLFSPRQVGRVTDLIAARVRAAGHDELRLRSLLLLGVFEAYYGQTEAGIAGLKALGEPVIVECG